MYNVYRFGKRLKSLGSFFTYENARTAARRYIRKNLGFTSFTEIGVTNPNISDFGIAVKRV